MIEDLFPPVQNLVCWTNHIKIYNYCTTDMRKLIIFAIYKLKLGWWIPDPMTSDMVLQCIQISHGVTFNSYFSATK